MVKSEENTISEQINELQRRITKIEVTLREDKNNNIIQVGDRVRIKNPREGQAKEGVVIKFNEETRFVTVQGKRKQNEKIRRHEKNIDVVERRSNNIE